MATKPKKKNRPPQNKLWYNLTDQEKELLKQLRKSLQSKSNLV